MNEQNNNPGQRQFGEDVAGEIVKELEEQMKHGISNTATSPRTTFPGTAPTAPEVNNFLSWVSSFLGGSCDPTKKEQERGCRVCGL